MLMEYFHKIDRFVYQEKREEKTSTISENSEDMARKKLKGSVYLVQPSNQPCRPVVGLLYQLLFCLKRHLLFFFF
ncbi:hypothetical protein PRUPE_1G072700 [Prunus persica]|uniref:Uncharacterized protein n=1 Tax=Prunus persica TaxID=3760 RepID=M5XG97_PRUPE|nr:hypothetical protein PRUPE_1G072700 [Prunus persica]